MNFVAKSIVYATFKKGKMVEKMEEEDENVRERIF